MKNTEGKVILRVNISTTPFVLQVNRQKPSKQWYSSVRFIETELTLDELSMKIKAGYSFTNLFSVTQIPSLRKEHTLRTFREATQVWVDIDNGPLPFNDFISRLTLKPSLAYTTTSYKPGISNRYRLGYAIIRPILDIATYRVTYNHFLDSISQDYPDWKNEDDCGRRAHQLFLGNSTESCITITNNVEYEYTPADLSPEILVQRSGFLIDLQKDDDVKNLEFVNKVLAVTDGPSMRTDLRSLLAQWSDQYECFDGDHVEYDEEGISTGENYRELYWPRAKRREFDFSAAAPVPIGLEEALNPKWECPIPTKCVYRANKIDGEHRRRTLRVRALARKVLRPGIRYDHLLFNLVTDFVNHIDNSEDHISPKQLCQLTLWAYRTPIDESEVEKLFIIRAIKVNVEGIRSSGGCVQAVVREALKKRLYDKIETIYDPRVSLDGNLNELHSSGIECDERTLRRCIKERHLRPSPKDVMQSVCDPQRTVSENLAKLKAAGYDGIYGLGKSSVAKWIKGQRAVITSKLDNEE